MLAHEIQTNNQTQSIVAMLDQTADDILKDFRCNCCGRIIFQYYGQVKLILPGQIEISWLEIVGRPKSIQCKNKRKVIINGREIETKCKTMYHIIG